MAKKQKDSIVDWVKAHRIPVIIVAAVVVLGCIGLAARGNTQNEQNTETGQKQEEQQAKKYSISEEKAEEYCQDAGLLGKYINLKNYSIISISNYNKQFGDFGGWYDNDGKDILYFRWNGKNKLTDQLVHFDCWVSGTDENIHLHKLVADDNTLFDTTTSTIVDKDGKRISE